MALSMKTYDYLVVGGGIIGLTIARELKLRFPHDSICILEKEPDVAHHSSGRNSGVLHAGFYYTANSLKARFTKEGNQEMTRYCEENNLRINKCGKVIVANSSDEVEGLVELKKRAEKNGVELLWINKKEVELIDANIETYQRALYSPTTSSVDPKEVCQTLKKEIIKKGVEVICNTKYKSTSGNKVITNKGIFGYRYVINAAGLYADKVAKDFNFGEKYTIIPFKGIYLQYKANQIDVSTNIYPVPNLANPFLGVHFTKTVNNEIKVGPTAIPSLWRENYSGLQNFKVNELLNILYYEMKLFLKNSFNFRSLAIEEIKKYRKTHLINLSLKMVKKIDVRGFVQHKNPGIRAQLLNKETLELVQDFVVEGDHRSFHVLNAVSPGFTCAFPFSRYVVDQVIERQKKEEEIRTENIS